MEFGVTAPTIQRVVARLEGRGLVQALHGSGVIVRDPRRHAGLDVLPLWFEAHASEPAAGAKMLGDVLAIRRGMAAQLIPLHREAILAAAPMLAGHLAAQKAASSLWPRAEADLAATRAVLEVCGNAAAVAIFNTVEQLVRTVPHVAEALYGDASALDANWADVMAAVALDDDPQESGRRLEAALAATDAAAVARFEERLTAAPIRTMVRRGTPPNR